MTEEHKECPVSVFVYSVSGRTAALVESACGMILTVGDGRGGGRSIVLNRESVIKLRDAMTEWLNKDKKDTGTKLDEANWVTHLGTKHSVRNENEN